MVRRPIAIGALCLIAIVATATIVWRAHVRAIGALLEAQAGVARTVMDGSVARDPRTILMAIARPGMHVRLLDLRARAAYDWQNGRIERHDGPPASGPDAPPPRAAPFGRMAADLAQVPPRSIVGARYVATLLADPGDLARVLATIAVLTAGSAALVVVALAGYYASERRKGAALAERQRNAEAEYRRFLADAGHELKTPLTIVRGYVDVLAERIPMDDSVGRRIVDGMRAESDRMRGLVEKMLLLARLEARVSVPQFVDASHVLGNVACELRRRYPDRCFALSCEPGANIVVDENDLYEAVRNVADNAVRYAPHSVVRLGAHARGREAVVTIADDGPGIPREEQSLVFERFYRGRSSADADGSGLGLAIVRGVASRWDGTIEVASSASGTTFTMRFPLIEESDA
jgi:signal transduction histidine kinase